MRGAGSVCESHRPFAEDAFSAQEFTLQDANTFMARVFFDTAKDLADGGLITLKGLQKYATTIDQHSGYI